MRRPRIAAPPRRVAPLGAAAALASVLAAFALAPSPLLAQPSPTPAAESVVGSPRDARPPIADRLRERAETPRRYLRDSLPEEWREVQFLRLYLWQWIAVVVLPLLALTLARVIHLIARPILRRLAARTPSPVDDALVRALEAPARVALAVLFLALLLPIADLPPRAANVATSLLIALGVAAAAWMALRVIDVSAHAALTRADVEKKRSMLAIVQLGRRAGKIFVYAIALLVLLANLGVNVTGLLAGLGVGGIAIALAAQKTIENIFGGISVIVDGTVRVGDTCQFGNGRVGVIERIGLRSTWIRTQDRTVVSIPNADFSLRELENYDARDRMRLYTVLGLRYETSPAQMRTALDGLRRLLETHPRVSPEERRVRFIGFSPSALDVEVFAYVLTSNYQEFLALREEIYLRMMDVIEAAGTSFAFPSQTVFLGRDRGAEARWSREARQTPPVTVERSAGAPGDAQPAPQEPGSHPRPA